MRRFKWFLFASALAATALAATLLVRQSPTLVDRADRVTDTYDWDSWNAYDWLPNSDLLIYQHPGGYVAKSIVDGAGHLRPTANRPIQQALKSELGVEFRGIAPNLKSVLLSSGSSRNMLSPLRGAAQESVSEIPHLREWRWLADSTGVVSIHVQGRRPIIKTYYVNRRRRIETVTPDLPAYSPLSGFRGGSLQPHVSGPGVPGHYAARWPAPLAKLFGVTARNTAILTTWVSGQNTDVDLFEVSLKKNAKPLRTHTVQIDPGYRVDEVVLSSTANRVLMRLYTSAPESGLHKLLERLGVLRRNQRTARDEIWVSDLNGRNRRLVGSVPVRPHGLGYESWVPMELRWLPDGKRISFIYENGLYVIEAVK